MLNDLYFFNGNFKFSLKWSLAGEHHDFVKWSFVTGNIMILFKKQQNKNPNEWKSRRTSQHTK